MKKEIELIRKEKDKNISLFRNNQRLIKMLKNLSYTMSTDDFILKEIDTEKFRIFSR